MRGWDGSPLWTRHRLPLEPLTECCDGNAVCLLAWSGVQNCRVLSTSLRAGGEGNRLGCVSWRNAAAGQQNRQGVLVVPRLADCVASVRMSLAGGVVCQAGRWRAGGGQVEGRWSTVTVVPGGGVVRQLCDVGGDHQHFCVGFANTNEMRLCRSGARWVAIYILPDPRPLQVHFSDAPKPMRGADNMLLVMKELLSIRDVS